MNNASNVASSIPGSMFGMVKIGVYKPNNWPWVIKLNARGSDNALNALDKMNDHWESYWIEKTYANGKHNEF